jgi:hypothetical protein
MIAITRTAHAPSAPTRRTACQHQPPCPPAGQPGCLTAVIIAAHPEQGWNLLCNGVVVFEDTGAIVAGHVVAPRRAATRPGSGTSRAALARQQRWRASAVEGIISFCVISFVITLSAAAHLLPILVAWLRRSPDLGAVIVLDLILGWCLIGWIAGLAIGLRRHAPAVQVINQVHVPVSSHGYACWLADGPVPTAAALPAPGSAAPSDGRRG